MNDVPSGWSFDPKATFASLKLRAGDSFAVRSGFVFVLLNDVTDLEDEVRAIFIEGRESHWRAINFTGGTPIDNTDPFLLARAVQCEGSDR